MLNRLRSRQRRRPLHGNQQRRGAAAIEYAMLLSVLAVAIIAGAQRANGVLQSVYQQTLVISESQGTPAAKAGKKVRYDGNAREMQNLELP